MQLKQLELSGFKSFAKKTIVDFTPGVTAVVGPNGSGKSNIVDALRWVLAEQSFRNLRGKKGEDFIFHGSGSRNALPRARVELTLTNSRQEAALDAEEIVISREVIRTGENTYKINGRSVRLMDVEEFLSRSRVGSSTFRILSQGMSDLLLTLGPQELRAFIEEAAGLKEFQDKKERSLKKIEATKENVARVGALIAEIAPQLRFLKREVTKFSKRSDIEQQLKDVARTLFGFRHASLVKRENAAAQEKKKLTERVGLAEKEIGKLEKELVAQDVGRHKETDVHALQDMRAKDHELSRQVVRLEGQLEVEKERARRLLPVTQEYVKQELANLIKKAQKGDEGVIKDIIVSLSSLVAEIEKGRAPQDNSKQIELITKDLKEVQAAQEKVLKEILVQEEKQKNEREDLQKVRTDIVEREKLYRRSHEELRELERALGAVELEQEKITVRREQLRHDIESIGVLKLSDVIDSAPEKLDEQEQEKKMFSLKKRLDTVGSIDPAIEKEYASVDERYTFLTSERDDLIGSLTSLEEMIDELEEEMHTRFKKALSQISTQFHHNLALMFGGGEGSLAVVRQTEYGEEAGDEDKKEGICISISLPNKKVKKLEMLSGGERTLVSIALLFALVNIRKPPFLVLDEIDAALDEANSQKFIRLVADRSKETQFVIITHNRETMRGADALYGVSMKDGISQLLSLKLEAAEQTATTPDK